MRYASANYRQFFTVTGTVTLSAAKLIIFRETPAVSRFLCLRFTARAADGFVRAQQ